MRPYHLSGDRQVQSWKVSPAPKNQDWPPCARIKLGPGPEGLVAHNPTTYNIPSIGTRSEDQQGN